MLFTPCCKKLIFLYSIAGPDLQKKAMYINTEIPRTLTEICPHQGIGSNTMFNDSERSHKESASPYKMRIERHNCSKAICDSGALRIPSWQIGLSEISLCLLMII